MQSGAISTATFLENHDQPQFQSLTANQSLVKNTMAWHGTVGREEGEREFMWVLSAWPPPVPYLCVC